MTNDAKNAMAAIMFRVKARPGKRDELIRFLLWDKSESLRKERGTLRFDVFQDPADEDAFYVYEVYEDVAAFKEHKKHPPFLQWSSAKFQRDVVRPHTRLKSIRR